MAGSQYQISKFDNALKTPTVLIRWN